MSSRTGIILRIVVTAAIVAILVTLWLIDLDTAAKVASIVACLIALPAIWFLPAQKRPDKTADQTLVGARSKGNIRQKSQRAGRQKMKFVKSDKDIEQSQ